MSTEAISSTQSSEQLMLRARQLRANHLGDLAASVIATVGSSLWPGKSRSAVHSCAIDATERPLSGGKVGCG
jgi:hypothetical protein